LLNFSSKLAKFTDFRDLTNNCLFYLNDLFRWYRYKEVAGIEAHTLIKSVLDNPQASKPIGCRNYLKFETSSGNSYVQVPDNLRMNDCNLYLSILFYENSYINFIDLGLSKVSQFGLNETVVVVNTKMSYWHMYATHILYVLNKGKSGLEETKTSEGNVTKSSTRNKNFSKTRSFSTSSRTTESNMVED
jgi:hypothetical protein